MSVADTNTHYRVIALPPDLAQAARATRVSPQYPGHLVWAETATGYGPCRACLNTFHAGAEERLLLSYDPFDGLDPYPLPGPVYIHAADCRTYDRPGFPPGLLDLPLVLEAYAEGRHLAGRETPSPGGGGINGVIDRLFALDGVRYLHVRNREAGCYIARIECRKV